MSQVTIRLETPRLMLPTFQDSDMMPFLAIAVTQKLQSIRVGMCLTQKSKRSHL
ncbi:MULTISPECIES: hypothetical protein [Nostoc]|uniref:Uncharacterized protein n=2 Tax=Nostoc TaxID=1177 RepID=A0ABR8IF56_9NOSO|nr:MULTISPECIES: hypothetical protein [Nostoc]MBD2559357.1 hypothetical protein [Nostoc linckia FACHB-391]MBD2650206.1 hypothetical protein [Nostoc foliaceum FACHB-393]